MLFDIFSILVKSKARNYPNTYHSFHILKKSGWPFMTSVGLFLLAISLVNWFAYGALSLKTSIFFESSIIDGILIIILMVYYWWKDVSDESGEHTNLVIKGLKIGMALFILSEVMFFFSFFWSFLHVSINPSIDMGHRWPPFGIDYLAIAPMGVPLLNTAILLTSGVFVTFAHKTFHLYFIYESLLNGLNSFQTIIINKIENIYYFFLELMYYSSNSVLYKKDGLLYLMFTLFFAVMFTFIQLYEYIGAEFSISDCVYGSTFFVMTGFHGFHVIIGTIFLTVCLVRIYFMLVVYKESTGLDCSIWYWHFVDVVWLFLFLLVYWWSFDDSIQQNEVKGLLSGFIEDLRADIRCLEKSEIVEEIEEIEEVEMEEEYFEPVIYKGYAERWQFGFQEPATDIMENIISLHNKIFYYLIVVFSIVISVLCFEVFNIDIRYSGTENIIK